MSQKNYGVVSSLVELDRLIQHIGSDVFAFDIETGYYGEPVEKRALKPEAAFIVGISFTNSTEWARYVPLAHDVGENFDNHAVAELLWPWLRGGKGVPHNAKFELRHMARFFRKLLSDNPQYGDEVRESQGYFTVFSDTQAQSYALAESKKHGLKTLVEEIFQHTMTELWELFPDLPKNKRKTVRFNVLELTPPVIDYACEDSLWTLALHRRNYPRVLKARKFIYDLEMAMIPVVCEMEDFGVEYDWVMLREASARCHAFIGPFNNEIQAELSARVGEPVQVNLGSPKQLSEILFDKLGMRVSRYTKSTRQLPKAQRKMSTDALALKQLAKTSPVVKRILQWKELRKLIGSYLDKYERDFNYAPDGRAHPDHLQLFVVTGRFSVADPAYQGSPKKYHYELPSGETFDLNFRDCIYSPKDHYILGFDYGQVELRGIAGLAQEPALLQAFERNEDVHSKTASLVLHKPLDSITDEDRQMGKKLNFAIDFGMQAKSLADQLVIGVEDAEKLLAEYYSAYRAIARWSAERVQFGRDHGYIETFFGRRCPVWNFEGSDNYRQLAGERDCVAYSVQGSATGDLPKIAMVRVRGALRKAGIADRVHLVMNIHDALNFYVHRSLEPDEVIKVLEPAVVFPVPTWPEIKAEWYIGRRWGSVRELERNTDGRWVIKEIKEFETSEESDLLSDEEEDE